ncbi:MAG: TetR/AcrR family transcriptional regulator [Myxococcales bacterium]|nr:TetR/AcrR family transcriptional regulator [Myxococcales bacterium]
MSKKKAYHHGDLRAALLAEAVAVIAEDGLASLSLRACARRLGVSHAAPYRHFQNKDAVLTAIAGQGFRWLVAEAKEAMAGLTDVGEQLDAYGVAYVEFALRNPVHHRVMFTSQLDPAMVDNVDQQSADTAFGLLRQLAAQLPGGAHDPDAAAFAFWSLVHGVSMLLLDGRVPPERLEGEGAVEQLVRGSFAYWRAERGRADG